MQRARRFSIIFAILAVLLFGAMCAVVAYEYCALQHCAYCSAPASMAFLLAIPYGVGIMICSLLSWFFYKRANKKG